MSFEPGGGGGQNKNNGIINEDCLFLKGQESVEDDKKSREQSSRESLVSIGNEPRDSGGTQIRSDGFQGQWRQRESSWWERCFQRKFSSRVSH